MDNILQRNITQKEVFKFLAENSPSVINKKTLYKVLYLISQNSYEKTSIINTLT